MTHSASTSPLTVSELTRQIRGLLETRLGSIWVKGEISNFRQQSSGHCYFTLKDASAQLSAVLFKSAANYLTFQPKDGQQVALFGEITVYELQGKYQIVVREMQPQGVGDLQQRFEALKKKLFTEGLFDSERKKPLPRYPSHLGIVTSPTGAAIQDMLNILKRRAPQIQIYLFPVRVQGINAAREICQAIEHLSRWQQKNKLPLDALILSRGGGSLEDLWPFNEESVARALAACPIPTISGVGHEVDFTIADFVADLRAPTPSAAAELAIPDRQDTLKSIHKCYNALYRATANQLSHYRLHFHRLIHSVAFRDPARVVALFQQRLDDLADYLLKGPQRAFQQKQQRFTHFNLRFSQFSPKKMFPFYHSQLKSLVTKLELLNPLHTLKRGFAFIKTSDGKIVRSATQLPEKTLFQVQLHDGNLEAIVKKNFLTHKNVSS